MRAPQKLSDAPRVQRAQPVLKNGHVTTDAEPQFGKEFSFAFRTYREQLGRILDREKVPVLASSNALKPHLSTLDGLEVFSESASVGL